jgi:hypothetical protein
MLRPSFSPENPEQVDVWMDIVFEFLKMVLISREMCIVTWHKAEHIFSSVGLKNLISEDSNETVDGTLHYIKATITELILSDIFKSPQFAYSELAFASQPIIKDALTLRGSIKNAFPKLSCEYVCMTHDGSSLLWLNPMPGYAKCLLSNKSSKILVS